MKFQNESNGAGYEVIESDKNQNQSGAVRQGSNICDDDNEWGLQSDITKAGNDYLISISIIANYFQFWFCWWLPNNLRQCQLSARMT